LMQKKPGREISIDQSALIVKDRQQDLLCSTTTELETVNAFRRRALAFDLVKCCGFHAMNYVPFGALRTHSSSTTTRLLCSQPCSNLACRPSSMGHDRRKDQQSQKRRTRHASAGDRNPKSLGTPICFVPPPAIAGQRWPSCQARQARAQERQITIASKTPTTKTGNPPAKGHGKGKGCKGSNKKGRGPNVPKGLINKSLQTDAGERLCWAFNLEKGCSDAPPGGKCARGLHLCTEPGCQKPHSMQNHK